MNAIKKARRLIETDPFNRASTTLAHLVRALEADEPFDIGLLYVLDLNDFELALEILQEWMKDAHSGAESAFRPASRWQLAQVKLLPT